VANFIIFILKMARNSLQIIEFSNFFHFLTGKKNQQAGKFSTKESTGVIKMPPNQNHSSICGKTFSTFSLDILRVFS